MPLASFSRTGLVGMELSAVLWDIDHTLIDVGRFGHVAFQYAFSTVMGGTPSLPRIFTGRTSLEIIRGGICAAGRVPTPDLVKAIAEAEARFYDDNASLLREVSRRLPGAARALETLRDEYQLDQTIVTGNSRAVADSKLRAADLRGFILLGAGSFGLETTDRSRLIQLAVQRLSRCRGSRVEMGDILVIGDSVRDVSAATQCGARVMAVSSGPDDTYSLLAAHPTAVLESLAELPAALRQITKRGMEE